MQLKRVGSLALLVLLVVGCGDQKPTLAPVTFEFQLPSANAGTAASTPLIAATLTARAATLRRRLLNNDIFDSLS